MNPATAAAPRSRDDQDQSPWAAELTDVVRGMSGGLLFGVPLLYTMEVWWTGTHTSPLQMLAVLALLFVPAFALNRTAGFRSARDVRTVDALADTIETVAIGLVTTFLVLVLLRQVTLDSPLSSGLAMVLYESVPFVLGVGLARHFLHGGRARADEDDDERDRTSGKDDELHATLADLGATTLGAIFISLSIAPTDEVPLVASGMDPLWLLVFVAASLLVSYGIVFVAGFTRQEQREAQEGVFQDPLPETIAAYLVGLAIALLMLWLFQREIAFTQDLLARVVVLGLPAAVGGAAGRLAL
jgi:putative integral membrane protein (TIGR02587 family)